MFLRWGWGGTEVDRLQKFNSLALWAESAGSFHEVQRSNTRWPELSWNLFF